eukprot:2930494-Alexandrium_andersonii.AAC.1
MCCRARLGRPHAHGIQGGAVAHLSRREPAATHTFVRRAGYGRGLVAATARPGEGWESRRVRWNPAASMGGNGARARSVLVCLDVVAC